MHTVAAALVAACLCASVAFAQDKKPPEEDPEVKLGREGSAENDKTVKLITDPVIVDRVNRIGQELAAVANELDVPALWGDGKRKKFAYSFKVVDDKDVNAYSLPGGFIYVNRGLLDFVHSDDELAGVLAHEVAHASHHHMIKLLREQNKIQQAFIPALLAAVLAKGSGNDIGNLLVAGQLFAVAKINSYGVEAEKDADNAGLIYLTKTKYNPVGLLTFMERLARQERLKPQIELGIYRTHPPSPERALAMTSKLKDLDVVINRSDVDPTLRASFEVVTLGGVAVAEVKMRKLLIARLAGADTATAAARGRELADKLDRLFDGGLQMYELRMSGDKSRIIARGATLVVYSDADAKPQNVSLEQAGTATMDAIKSLIWQEQLNRSIVVGGSR